VPEGLRASPHLSSRLHVEEALLSGSSVFVADRGMAGLAAFRRRGRTG